ncbi:MAG TPA: NADP-dependent oxidoreductase [Stellaceae bacterium]|nr:NADP-dependent oxidoreductase [Stellaceae bacterium]
MPQANRVWFLSRRPEGDDFQSALDFTSAPMPELKDGDVLIRNGYLSMDAGTRMWMNPREDSYMPPTPLGVPVQGMVLGVVTDSRHPDYRAGDLVRAYGQWADYSVSRPDDTYVARLSWRLDDLRQYLAVFGPNGWTAYWGIVETGQAKPGETVVISSAAGATGALAGQVAKAIGCRVIGITGTAEKAAWIRARFGFDDTVSYKSSDVAGEIARLCPNGVDLYYDSVAGLILDAMLANMALFGRIAVCGTMNNYDKTGPIPGPYKFDQILMKRLRIEGFFSPDFYHRGPEINRKTAAWHRAGKLDMAFEEVDGLENTVAGYRRLFTGANRGKVLIKLAELSPDLVQAVSALA